MIKLSTWTIYRIDPDTGESRIVKTHANVDEAYIQRRINGFNRLVKKASNNGIDAPFIYVFREVVRKELP